MLPLAFVLSLCPSLVVPASVEEAATPPAPKVAVLEAKLLERRAADRDDPLPVEALAEACRDAQDIDGEAAYLLCAADLIDKLEVDDARAVAEPLAQVISRADAALDRAKHDGQNRAVAAGPISVVPAEPLVGAAPMLSPA